MSEKESQADQLRQQVIEAAKAGFRPEHLAEHFGLPVSQVQLILDDHLTGTHPDLDAHSAMELERLDALHAAVWKQARAGDLGAVSKAMGITRLRNDVLDRVAHRTDDDTTDSSDTAEWASLAEMVRAGDHLGALRTLGDRLATEIDRCSTPTDVGLLSRQLLVVFDRLHQQGPDPAEAREEEIEDELAARRAAGQSGTHVRARSRLR